MNIRKNIDYSGLYAGIDKALAANLPQMELYLELGRLVSGRPEKGAAVMAAEYIAATYPDRTGFSPRSLRRMRDFYRMYEGHPEALAQAMKNSWTQNIVILEADLDMDARCWYLRAAWQLGWSKAELIKQIDTNAHLRSGNEETTPASECAGTSKGSVDAVRKTVIRTVAFPCTIWYNWLCQVCFFRQMGTKGEIYG